MLEEDLPPLTGGGGGSQQVLVVSQAPPAVSLVFTLSQKFKLEIISRFCFMFSDPLLLYIYIYIKVYIYKYIYFQRPCDFVALQNDSYLYSHFLAQN